jgi:hypothetical protein
MTMARPAIVASSTIANVGVYAKKMGTGHVPTEAELDDLVAYVGAL